MPDMLIWVLGAWHDAGGGGVQTTEVGKSFSCSRLSQLTSSTSRFLVVPEQQGLRIHDEAPGGEVPEPQLLAWDVDQALGNTLLGREAAFSSLLMLSVPNHTPLTHAVGDAWFPLAVYLSPQRANGSAHHIPRAPGLPPAVAPIPRSPGSLYRRDS